MKNILKPLIVMMFLLSTQNLVAQFAGGDGTSSTPYQIATAAQLAQVHNYYSSYFILNNDIDLNVSPYNSGTGWPAISGDGSSSYSFTGKFNGNGKKIINLMINNTADYQGLFGSIIGAEIKNLGVEGVNIAGSYDVGGLVGYSALGGCTISNCYTTGSVTGGSHVGGVIGSYTSTDIISNCYSRAAVTGNGNVGGFVGYIDGTYSAPVISNCYSTGAVVVLVDASVGGFSGNAGNAVFITNCFYDETTSGRSDTHGGTGELTADMKTNSIFLGAGWSPSTWYMDAGFNDGYPYLAWQNPSGTPLPVELTSFTAQAIGNNITLNWQTATEVNNYGFEVERMAVNSWVKIGFVKGSGTSNAPKAYSFIDSKLSSGSYVYRLKQIDNDGAYKYSANVELEVKSAPAALGLVQNFPNPFNPSTKISFSLSKTEQAKLVVYNLLGQQVKTLFDGVAEAQKNYEMNFDASGCASGIYFYKLTTPTQTDIKRMQLMK